MKNRVLEKSLPIVARMISSKYDGLRVMVGGNRACTDGSTIYLPTLPETEEALILARGYIDHEAAHIRFTNFGVPNDFLTNALEDIRIEDKLGAEFRGSKKNLRELSEWFVRQGEIQVSNETSDHDVLAMYVHFKLREEVLGHNVANVLQPAEQEFLKRFGSALKNEVDKIVHPKLRSTMDASQRAKKLRDLLPKQPELQQQQDQGQQGQQGQSGQSGESGQEDQDGQSDQGQSGQDGESGSGSGSGSGGSESSDESGQGSSGQSGETGQDQGSGSDSGENTDEGEGADDSDNGDEAGDTGDSGDSSGTCGNGAGSGNADPNRSQEETFQGLGEAIEEALNQISQDLEDDTWTGMPQIPTPAPGSVTPGNIDEGLKQCLQRGKARSAQLRYKLQTVLEAKRKDQKKIRRSGKKFSNKNLHRLSCGDTRIFSRKIESRAVNTAVHLLLDTSGSMYPDRIGPAMEACYALGVAMEKLKYVNLAISSFPDTTGIREIKRFEDPLREEAFRVFEGGGTPTAGAMLYSAYTLAQQKEPRKMIFVITDGGPDSPTAVKEIEEWLNGCGVEVIGLGIQCTAVEKVFNESIVVNDLSELATSIFKTLEKKL